MANHRARFSWSDLPQELLSEIAIRITTRPDLCNFRSVCKSWKNSVSQSLLDETKHLLDSVFPYTIVNTNNIWQELTSLSPYQYRYKTVPLVVVPVSICLLRPATDPTQRPWIICTEERNPGKLFLRPPLSRDIYDTLPSTVPSNLDLSSLIVTELYKGHYIGFVNPGNKKTLPCLLRCEEISKVVLYKNPDCLSNPSPENFTLILLHVVGYVLAMRMSDGENSVHNIRVPGVIEQIGFLDVVNFRGVVYAVNATGMIYAINYHNLSVKRVTELSTSVSGWYRRLVVSSDENKLYMVCREYYQKGIISLYKLDLSKERWTSVENFGDNDRVLFMTCDACFFAPVKEFPDWKDFIVSCECGFSLFGSCRLENRDQKRIKIYEYNTQYPRFLKSMSMIDYSSVLWPPPGWLSTSVTR